METSSTFGAASDSTKVSKTGKDASELMLRVPLLAAILARREAARDSIVRVRSSAGRHPQMLARLLPTLSTGARSFSTAAAEAGLDQHLQFMSRYHRWANERLYKGVAALSEDQQRSDHGLVFHSALGTLHHLVLSDAIWLSRIKGAGAVPPSVTTPEHELSKYWTSSDLTLWNRLSPPLEDLLAAQMDLCDRWDALLEEESPSTIMRAFQYKNTRGQPFEKRLGPILAHVFNHGTHHRGQVSVALTAQGQRFPVLDLLYFIDEAS
jgi:uncharacterized damage-inducible protein DinB